MTTRALGALMWFAVVGFGYEILWSVADVPRLVGPVFAAIVATLVMLDPIGRFWRSRSSGYETARQLRGNRRSLV